MPKRRKTRQDKELERLLQCHNPNLSIIDSVLNVVEIESLKVSNKDMGQMIDRFERTFQ